jgi:hypothetical protein
MCEVIGVDRHEKTFSSFITHDTIKSRIGMEKGPFESSNGNLIHIKPLEKFQAIFP